MSARAPGRMLIELGLSGEDAEAVATAVALARLLGLDLRGVFVEDEALLALAGHSFARELQMPGHAWMPIEVGDVMAELDLAAARSRRMLEAACAGCGLTGGFELLRGDRADWLAGICAAEDVVALGTPGSAAGWAFGGFARAWRAARASAASVLLLPPRAIRRRGPVAMLVSDGAAEEIALRVAAAQGEALVLLEPPGASGAAMEERARHASIGVSRRRIRAQDAGAIAAALRPAEESLLVLGRDAVAALAADEAPRLAALRHVPVLLR